MLQWAVPYYALVAKLAEINTKQPIQTSCIQLFEYIPLNLLDHYLVSINVMIKN